MSNQLPDFKSDLKKFAVIFFKGMMEYETPAFHDELYYLLQTKDRLAIAAPRGFAKSSVCVVIYACWLALLGIRKDICIVSASESLSVELLRKIKYELVNNARVVKMFGNVQSDKWKEEHIVLRNGVIIRAKGSGGQLRGFRPDCILLDDIENNESCESEELRKKLKEWLFKEVINCLLPGGQLAIIGTLIHPLSVLSELIDTPRKGWTRRKYRAYIEGIEAQGHELWPQARPHEWLQQRKAEIGSWAFAAEFMNDPKLDEGAPIKENLIRYWTELPSQYSAVIAIDPAYSENVNADHKVAMVCAIDLRGNRYVIEYIRTHSPTGEFLDAALNMYLRHQATVTSFGCPNSGTEKEFYRSLENRASERKIYPPLTELKNAWVNAETGVSVRNKRKRIVAALQPLFEQGKFYIHADHFELKEELLTIGSSRWDDLVDCATYCDSLFQIGCIESGEGFGDMDQEPELVEANESWGIEY